MHCQSCMKSKKPDAFSEGGTRNGKGKVCNTCKAVLEHRSKKTDEQRLKKSSHYSETLKTNPVGYMRAARIIGLD